MTGRRSLSDEDERRLLVDHEDGFKNVELVKRYGISESTVYRILAANKAQRKIGNKTKHRKPRDLPRRGRKVKLKPCGTNAAYNRHIRNGDPPCLPCVNAHAKQQKEWSDSKKETK